MDNGKCPLSTGSIEDMLNDVADNDKLFYKEGCYGISITSTEVSYRHVLLLWARWLRTGFTWSSRNRIGFQNECYSVTPMLYLKLCGNDTAFWEPMLTENQACQGEVKVKYQRPRAKPWEVTTEAFIEKCCLDIDTLTHQILWGLLISFQHICWVYSIFLILCKVYWYSDK